MRIFIYSRKSVQTQTGDSIENQVELCRRYIASQIEGSGQAELSVYEDEGFSGKSLDRPQFQRMLADTRKQKVDYIVCYRLDRISRSVCDFAPLAEDLAARAIGLICIKEQFDTSTPMGRAMMYIASVFAQLERETIAQRVRDNMLLLARTGRWLGGTPPTGFTSERVREVLLEGKVKTSCRLRAEPQEIEVVKRIYQSYLRCHSLNGVWREMRQQGIRSRSGGSYSLLGIREILQNPVYCAADAQARAYFAHLGAEIGFAPERCSERYGLLAYNRREHASKEGAYKDPSQWILARGSHPGVVSGADWIRVQAQLQAAKQAGSNKRPQSRSGDSLLSGTLFCAQCGARMFAKRRSNNRMLFDYICANKLQNTGTCNCQNLSGRQADEQIGSYLDGFAHADSGIVPLLEEVKGRLARQAPLEPACRIDRLIGKKERELEGLVLALSAAAGSPAVMRRIGEAIEKLDRELRELGEQKQQMSQRADDRTSAQTALRLEQLPFTGPGLTVLEKRVLLRLLVQRIEWDGKNIQLTLYQR